jgi:hypothetical protein
MSRSPPRKRVRFTCPEAPATPPLTLPLSETHDHPPPTVHDQEPAPASASKTSHLPAPVNRAPQPPSLASTSHRGGGYVFARLRETERIVASDDLNLILGYVPLTPPPPPQHPLPTVPRQRPHRRFITTAPPAPTPRLPVPPVAGMWQVNHDTVAHTPLAEPATSMAPPSMDPVAVCIRRTYNSVGEHVPTAATPATPAFPLPHQRPLPEFSILSHLSQGMSHTLEEVVAHKQEISKQSYVNQDSSYSIEGMRVKHELSTVENEPVTAKHSPLEEVHTQYEGDEFDRMLTRLKAIEHHSRDESRDQVASAEGDE